MRKYWLVHRGRVDVPAMYDPQGRYRYYHGTVRLSLSGASSDVHRPIRNQNWRAVLALLVSVPPNFPGLIASITRSVDVGRIGHVYDFAWLFGVRSHVLSRRVAVD